MTIASVPRGVRRGRPPRPVPELAKELVRRATWTLGEEQAPYYSLEDLAEQLNEQSPTPPRPGRQQKWTASAVRNVFRAIREERLVFLLRMGSLLDAVRHAQPVEVGDLLRLGRRHQVDIYWLWDRFHLGAWVEVESSLVPRLAPPIAVDRRTGTATVSEEGRHVLKLYEQIDAYQREVQDVLAQLRVVDSVSRAGLRRICRWYGTTPDAVVATGLLVPLGGNRYAKTPAGDAVGQSWHVITHEDVDEGRWEAEFLPDPDEERLLPTNWDWDDRPPIPPICPGPS